MVFWCIWCFLEVMLYGMVVFSIQAEGWLDWERGGLGGLGVNSVFLLSYHDPHGFNCAYVGTGH